MNKTKLFIITILAISVLAIPIEASTINYNASDCRKIVMKKGTKAKVTNTGWKKFKIKVSDRKVVKVVKNGTDRKSTRLNSSHMPKSRMPSSA